MRLHKVEGSVLTDMSSVLDNIRRCLLGKMDIYYFCRDPATACRHAQRE